MIELKEPNVLINLLETGEYFIVEEYCGKVMEYTIPAEEVQIFFC